MYVFTSFGSLGIALFIAWIVVLLFRLFGVKMRFTLATALLSAVTIVCGLVVPRANDGATSPVLPSLLEADLEMLVTGLESGAFTSVDLVNAYTARIMEVNSTLHMVGTPMQNATNECCS